MMVAVRRVLVVLGMLGVITACGKSSSKTPAVTLPPTTRAPATTLPQSALTVTGVSPGVEEAMFYPSTPITTVACGKVPKGGTFVEFVVPGATTPAFPRSALASPTAVSITPGKAVLYDTTGKVLYEQDLAGITTVTPGSTGGTLVVSMTNVTYSNGKGQPVEAGAMNVNGSFTCSTMAATYPGL